MRKITVVFFTLGALACGADPTPSDLLAPVSNTGAKGAAAADITTCPACTFGPRSYVRTTGQPVTDVATFAGDPAGAYFIEIDDHGSQGANATVLLNGSPIDARSGHLRRPVSLLANNQLQTRLTGKPGSTLEVKIFQEVHSVDVSPHPGLTRMPASQQFTAVARDANGVAIPNQTFEWSSSNATIATIGAESGLATTTGAVNNTIKWNYNTISTGEGTAQITAHAIGTTVEGSAPWQISGGFVYSTYRAPLALTSPNRAKRPNPEPLRYDAARLSIMANRCGVENANVMWFEYSLGGERQFHQCFTNLALETPRRRTILGVDIIDAVPNVGVYGRYCGEGHPDGTWYHDFANSGNYPPKDPIDAVCMEHDAQEQNHELSTSDAGESLEATCIVRYGIEAETLFEDGVRVQPGSTRWNAFWDARPAMAAARQHFLSLTKTTCTDDTALPGGGSIPGVYSVFLFKRGLTPP